MSVPTGAELVLASASPRRRLLLAGLGLKPRVRPTTVDESWPDDDPSQAVALAERKLEWSLERHPVGTVILAADTIVRLEDKVLGKPLDAAAARSMLAELQGREHLVTSGVAVGVVGGGRWTARVDSAVRLRPLSASRIAAYVAGGSPLDKAGAYAVQDAAGAFPDPPAIHRADRRRRFEPRGSWLVECVTGSLSNVIGLPLVETAVLLRRSGIEVNHG